MADTALIELIASSLIGYACGAAMHIYIDYRHGKLLLRQYWDATDRKIAGIESEVIVGLKRELGEFPEVPTVDQLVQGVKEQLPDVPTVDVGAGLETFLRSEPGVQWARELASLAASDFEAAFIKRGTDQKGINARRQQSQTASILLNGIDFGDSRMNALWAFLPDEQKRAAVQRIARAIHRAGFLLVPINEVPGAAQEALEGPSSDEPPPWGSV